MIIIHDQKILLTRNWYGNGCWSLPGGGQKSDESLSDTAKREVLEETGIEIKESELRELGEHRGSISGLGYRYHLFLYRSIKPPTVSQNTLEIRETIWMSKREVLESSLSSDLKSLSSKWFE